MSFSYPPHLTILAWVFSDFFLWLTTKCPHAVPKCKQLSYQYIWPTLATYNKSCEWCEVKKTNFPTRAPWTVFRPIIADGKPSCPWLNTNYQTNVNYKQTIGYNITSWFRIKIPDRKGSWGQHGAHLGPVVPMWAPCWPHEPCYQVFYMHNTEPMDKLFSGRNTK